MGDWDYYCFLCAINFSPYAALEPQDEHDEDEPDEDGQDDEDYFPEDDPSFRVHRLELTSDNLAWLSNFRVIGENPAAAGLRRCYLSGRAQESDYGHADVAKGKDPVAPGSSQDDIVDISMYHDFDAEDETGALPVHECCLKVLRRAFVARGLRKGDVFEASDEDFGFNLDGVGVASADEEGFDNEMAEEVIVKTAPVHHRLDIDALYLCLSSKREDVRRSLCIDYGVMNEMSCEQYFSVERGKEVRQPISL